MKAIYLFFYITSMILSLGSLGLIIYNLKIRALDVKKKVSGRKDTSKEKNTFKSVKKSAILLYFAKKGYIKIREDSDGAIYIDKLASFENIAHFGEALEELYKDNVSYYSDDTAIMSYETVPWDSAKEKLVGAIDRILGTVELRIEDDAKDTKSEKKGTKQRVFAHKIRFFLFINWVFCLFPIALTYAMNDTSDKWAAGFAIYVIAGLIYVFVKAIIRCIAAVKKFMSDCPLVLLILSWFVQIIFAMILLLSLVFAIALFSVAGEMWMEGPALNMMLETVLALVTIIMFFLRWKYSDPDIILNFSAKGIKKSAKDKVPKFEQEHKTQFDLYHEMLAEMKELEKAKEYKDEQPVWYEGDNWNGVKELELKLENK